MGREEDRNASMSVSTKYYPFVNKLFYMKSNVERIYIIEFVYSIFKYTIIVLQ